MVFVIQNSGKKFIRQKAELYVKKYTKSRIEASDICRATLCDDKFSLRLYFL